MSVNKIPADEDEPQDGYARATYVLLATLLGLAALGLWRAVEIARMLVGV